MVYIWAQALESGLATDGTMSSPNLFYPQNRSWPVSLKGTASSGPTLRSGIVRPKRGSPKKTTVATNSGLERTPTLITMYEVWDNLLRMIQSLSHPSMAKKGLLRFFSDRICWRESPMIWNLGPSAWKAMRQSFLQILWPTGSLGTLKAVPRNGRFLNFCCVLLCFAVFCFVFSVANTTYWF